MNRGNTQQCIYSTSRMATAIFPLENRMWFEPSGRATLWSAAGHCVCLALPLLHSFHGQHLARKGSDTSGHRNLCLKPRAPGLDSQSFIRQITPRRSSQSSEVHNKIPVIIPASFSLPSFLKSSSSCFNRRDLANMISPLTSGDTLRVIAVKDSDNIPGK